MPEKLLFLLPKYWEELLYAVPVLMQYLETRIVTDRAAGEVTIVCHEEMQSFVQSCWWPAQMVSEIQEGHKEADLIFDFDTDIAWELGKAQKKYLSDIYAIQLGVGLLRILPPILLPCREEPGYTLVVARNKNDRPLEGTWPHREAFIELGHEQDISMGYLHSGAGWQETLAAVGRASVVVGVRSTATMVAAAAGKIVLELNSESWGYQEWMAKWNCRTYTAARGDLQLMTAERLWERIGMLLEKWSKNTVSEVPVCSTQD